MYRYEVIQLYLRHSTEMLGKYYLHNVKRLPQIEGRVSIIIGIISTQNSRSWAHFLMTPIKCVHLNTAPCVIIVNV